MNNFELHPKLVKANKDSSIVQNLDNDMEKYKQKLSRYENKTITKLDYELFERIFRHLYEQKYDVEFPFQKSLIYPLEI